MKVLFIAPFPPPITGHSLAALVFHDDLVRTHQVASIDLSVGSAHDGAVSLRRIAEVGKVITRVFRHRHSADVVYLTIAESMAGNVKDLLIYLACAGRLSRVYIHLHGGSIKKLLFDRHPFLRWLNKSAIRRLGGVIITGHAHEHIFADMIDQQRVHLVSNFAQDDLFVSPHTILRKFGEVRPLRVLYLSSMTEPKGYLDLVEAYLLLGGTQRDLMRLDFAGKFSTSAEHDRFVNMTAGVAGIGYHGVLDGEAKCRLFAEAHVFCLPTKMMEGQPISILEAYASGCVVLTTGQDGIRDVFEHGQNGTEVPQGSPSALAAALGELAERGRSLLPIALENRRLADLRYRAGRFNAALRAIIEQAGPATGSVTSPWPPTDGAWGQKRRDAVAVPPRPLGGPIVLLVERVFRAMRRVLKKTLRLPGAHRHGILYKAPNFLYAPLFTKDSIIIDAGCGYQADFSLFMIKQYGVKAFAVDPTQKHRRPLELLEEISKGSFVYLPFAIGANDGALEFYESKVNESGSLLEDHVNIINDETICYEVQSVNLLSLLQHINYSKIDMLKLDLEGAEYELLSSAGRHEILPFRQIFVEFHHQVVTKYTEDDTKEVVKIVCGFGYRSYTLDDQNYLFVQS